MNTPINSFVGRIAVSRARSFLVYQFEMWLQHNLKASLRRNKPLCGVLSRHSLHGSLRFIQKWFKQAIRVADARKNKLLEVFI